jgi:hypothetical protein
MYSDQASSLRGESRRQFIRKTGLATAVVAGSGLFQFPLYANENNPDISIVLDESDPVVQQPPVQWAVQHLQNTLTARGVTLQLREKLELVPSSQECIFVGGPASNVVQPVLAAAAISLPDGPECLAIARGKPGQRTVLAAAGSDARGLVYALLELADRVRFADDPLVELRAVKPVSERPANAIRSVMRAFVSDVQDKPWFNDRAFWQSYLTMLATHRFNRFNLALGFGYDFTSGLPIVTFILRTRSWSRCPATTCGRCHCPTLSATATWKCCGSSARKPSGAVCIFNWASGHMPVNGLIVPTRITSSRALRRKARRPIAVTRSAWCCKRARPSAESPSAPMVKAACRKVNMASGGKFLMARHSVEDALRLTCTRRV